MLNVLREFFPNLFSQTGVYSDAEEESWGQKGASATDAPFFIGWTAYFFKR
jgi:hypothetical protein